MVIMTSLQGVIKWPLEGGLGSSQTDKIFIFILAKEILFYTGKFPFVTFSSVRC